MYQIVYEPLRFCDHAHVKYITPLSEEEYEKKYPSAQFTLIDKCDKFRIYLRKIDGSAYVEETKLRKNNE